MLAQVGAILRSPGEEAAQQSQILADLLILHFVRRADPNKVPYKAGEND